MAMNYTPIPDDFLEEMEELTDEEYGRLIRALQRYRMTGEMPNLPGNEVYCAKRGKMQIDRYVENYNKRVKAKSNAGRAGANKRWQNQIAENGNAISAITEDSNAISEDGKNGKTKTQTNTKTKTNTKVISSPKGSDITDTPLSPLTGGGAAAEAEIASDFDLFWAAYPRKVGKGAARKAFSKVKAPVESLVTAIRRQECSEQWSKENGRYIPNPATWLNQERWNDELPEAKSSNIFYEIGKERGLF